MASSVSASTVGRFRPDRRNTATEISRTRADTAPVTETIQPGNRRTSAGGAMTLLRPNAARRPWAIGRNGCCREPL